MKMMINRILILFFAATLVLFCSGCLYSTWTWDETGKSKTHIEDVRAEYTSPKELTVHSVGWQERNYLPFDWSSMGHFPWEQHIVLPLTRMPDEQTRELEDIEIADIKIEVDPRKSRSYKHQSGLWFIPQSIYTVHPDDIPHLSEPYVSYGSRGRLIIPLEVRETKDGRRGERQIHIKGYEAGQVHSPGEKTGQRMEGVGITIWRCCLLPVTIALDAATFPIQVYVQLDRLHMINKTPSPAQKFLWGVFMR